MTSLTSEVCPTQLEYGAGAKGRRPIASNGRFSSVLPIYRRSCRSIAQRGSAVLGSLRRDSSGGGPHQSSYTTANHGRPRRADPSPQLSLATTQGVRAWL